MKKFKKVIALGLAAMAAVSAMSISAFAAELDENAVYLENPTQEEMNYYADNRIDCYGTDKMGGEWSIHYYTDEEIANNAAMPTSLDTWSDNVYVPVTNIDGTNGAVLGDHDCPEFTVAPDSTIHIAVGDLDDTMPRVNVGVSRIGTNWYKMKTIGSNGEFSYTIPESYRSVLHRCTTSSNTVANYAYFTMWTD